MTRRQKRFACGDCSREWVYSHTGDETCPACGSTVVTRVEFEGLFDQHTPADVLARALETEIAPVSASRPSEIVAPPLTLVPVTVARVSRHESAIPEFA